MFAKVFGVPLVAGVIGASWLAFSVGILPPMEFPRLYVALDVILPAWGVASAAALVCDLRK